MAIRRRITYHIGVFHCQLILLSHPDSSRSPGGGSVIVIPSLVEQLSNLGIYSQSASAAIPFVTHHEKQNGGLLVASIDLSLEYSLK